MLGGNVPLDTPLTVPGTVRDEPMFGSGSEQDPKGITDYPAVPRDSKLCSERGFNFSCCSEVAHNYMFRKFNT